MDDTWSKINGYSNYSVSKNGEIRNDMTGKIKSGRNNRYGYSVVDLYSNGKRQTERVHRLVANTFIPNPENKSQVNHINGDKQNNSISNLEWCTASENMRHAFDIGLVEPSRSMLGKRNPNAGRHGRSVRIVETGEVFSSITECEKAIGGNNRHICDCLSGRQNTHRGYHFEYV